MKILIAGGGIAGHEVAASLAAKNGLEITILSAEKHFEYDPCSLPYYIGGVIHSKSVFRKDSSFYQAGNVRIYLDCPVAAIDSVRRAAISLGGETFSYDKLILAHGGNLFIPSIPGIHQEGVFDCKSLDQADMLARHRGTRALVIGSGAIGIEVAEALKRRSYEVTVVEVLPWVLPALFDEPAGRRLERALKDCGIQVFTGERVLAVNGGGKVTGVTTDKREIPCDTVVLATGVVPGRALAETAGIKVNRGILVDDRMATSVANIYACGDCVETPDACTGDLGLYQLKHNALDQAGVVAGNILGRDLRYAGAYVFARAHFFDTHAVTFGKTLRSLKCAPEALKIIERSKGKDYLQVILRNDVIVGGQAIGGFADLIGPIMAAMWRREKIISLPEYSAEKTKALSGFPWMREKVNSLLADFGANDQLSSL